MARMNLIKQNFMRVTPSAKEQEGMRMCRFCVHSHISDLGYNFCFHNGRRYAVDGDSPTGYCSSFMDRRKWMPCYVFSLISSYRGNICWARKVYGPTGKRILRYEIIDPVASTIANRTPKEFAKDYIIATPGSKPPYTMEEYEKWDTQCFGEHDFIKERTERQEERNYNEAHWQEILAQDAIEEQLE